MGHRRMQPQATSRCWENPHLSLRSLTAAPLPQRAQGPMGETLSSTFELWEQQSRASRTAETPTPSWQWENSENSRRWASGPPIQSTGINVQTTW